MEILLRYFSHFDNSRRFSETPYIVPNPTVSIDVTLSKVVQKGHGFCKPWQL